MSKRGRFVLLPLILTATFAMYAGSASALSDNLVVPAFNCSVSAPEGSPAAAEPGPLTCGTPFTPDATSTYVVLVEKEVDPTETLLVIPGTSTPVSDVVAQHPGDGSVEFFSDTMSGYNQVVAQLTPGAHFTPIDETGNLDEVGSLLGSPFPVFVQSEVPEPSTLLFFAGGLAGIAAQRRGRAYHA